MRKELAEIDELLSLLKEFNRIKGYQIALVYDLVKVPIEGGSDEEHIAGYIGRFNPEVMKELAEQLEEVYEKYAISRDSQTLR